MCACLILACGGAAADVVPGDRAALVDLYTATGGAGWTYKTGWNTAAGVCTWAGVYCGGDGSRVTQLCGARSGGGECTARSDGVARRNLGSNQLTGTIPDSIGSLTALTDL